MRAQRPVNRRMKDLLAGVGAVVCATAVAVSTFATPAAAVTGAPPFGPQPPEHPVCGTGNYKGDPLGWDTLRYVGEHAFSGHVYRQYAWASTTVWTGGGSSSSGRSLLADCTAGTVFYGTESIASMGANTKSVEFFFNPQGDTVFSPDMNVVVWTGRGQGPWYQILSPIAYRYVHDFNGADTGVDTFGTSHLGDPTSDTVSTVRGGLLNHFKKGSLYWSPTYGTHAGRGGILEKWLSEGAERGILGFPITDELDDPNGSGRVNRFENGSIYWSKGTEPRVVPN
jgi:LGFP repeat-containing protein